MAILLIITIAVILAYFLYPAGLALAPGYRSDNPETEESGAGVSVVLLTWNGVGYLREKVGMLAAELKEISNSEFIVIDDCSTDGTRELLESLKDEHNLNLVLKDTHRGIPHSMNTSVALAKYDRVVFCDQRQAFTSHVLSGLLVPLRDPVVGAVSGIISCRDRKHGFSLFRHHENLLKRQESRTGCIMGVYGPLYAIRKECYSNIPEHIILDDLYLSLRILAQKRIVLSVSSEIIDEDFSVYYSVQRSKRYLKGLWQILVSKGLVGELPLRMRLMLLWHKYLRLLIPPLAVTSFVAVAWKTWPGQPALLVPAVMAGLVALGLLSMKMVFTFKPGNHG